MKSKSHKWKITFVVFIIAIIFYLPDIITNNSISYMLGDNIDQMYYFLLGYWQMFHDGIFNNFTWSLGFGANGASMTFYNIFSPFNLLVLPFPKEFIKYSMTYLGILKFTCLGFTTSLWLSNLSSSFKNKLIVTLLFVFSGWTLSFYQVHFLDSYVYYPLILYFIDIYLLTDRKKGLIISVAILCIVNFYMMYMMAYLACFYAIARYIIINDNIKLKVLVKDALIFVVILVLSIFIGGIVLLPSIRLVLTTPRLASDSFNIFSIITIQDMYKNFATMFSYHFNYVNPFLLISTNRLSYSGWGAGASLYLGVLSPISIIYLIFAKKNKEIMVNLGALLVLFTMTLFPLFYKLFQGTIETRWFLIITIFLSYNIIIFLNYLEDNLNKKLLLNVLIVVTFIKIALILVSRLMTLSEYPILDIIQYGIVFITFLFLIGGSIYFKKKNILLFFIIFEVIFSNLVFWKFAPIIDKDDFYYDTEINQETEYLKNTDLSFYRVLYNNTDEYVNSNKPYADQIAGNSFYNSIYNYEQELFLNNLKSRWAMPQYTGYYNIRNMLASKYFIVNQLDDVLYPIGYEVTDNSKIYKNKYTTGLGFFSNNTLNSKVLDEVSDPIEKLYLYSHYLIGDNFSTLDYKKDDRVYENALTFFNGDYVEVNYDQVLSGDTIYIRNYGIPEIYIKLFDGDRLVKMVGNWKYDFIELYIPEELQIDKVAFVVYNDNPEMGIDVDILRDSEQYVKEVFDERKNNILTDTVVKGSTVYAKGVCEEDSTLFTSIPYDVGWTVWVNGEKHDYYKINDGFIGLDLEAGNYDLKFTYQIPWFNYGVITSISSLFVLIILIRKKII